jgi:hypothetical protein
MIRVSAHDREVWLAHKTSAACIHQMLSDLIGYDGLAQLIITFRSLLLAWKRKLGAKHQAAHPPPFTQLIMLAAICISIAHKCVADNVSIGYHLAAFFEVSSEAFEKYELAVACTLVRFTPFALCSRSLEYVMKEMGYDTSNALSDVNE